MYDLLSQPIRKYINDKRWASLRPIQVAAINHILTTEKNVILAAHTASGKTEAAFLPILSKVDFSAPGVRVLYISPLIALINDQFGRIEELCQYLSIPVTKWHGEASKSLKNKLLRDPKGVVLITPESLEAMLDNAPQNARHLFTGLEFIVIDEIHSFTGTDRGTQLKSILFRIHQLNCKPFRVVGLSATLGSFDEAKKLTGNPESTIVLRDKTPKELNASFRFYPLEGVDLAKELIDDLYISTKDHKVLIFPNSRGRSEEIAVRLKRKSEKNHGHPYYFSHHSSVHKELREYIEHFAKENKRFPFAISCTSTLELGIDIGSIDLVVQIDATHSVASLVQRTGRSGRGEGETSNLLLFATEPWSMLQALSCIELYRQGFIEPFLSSDQPYDILAHQILALVKQYSGCSFSKLRRELSENYAFKKISHEQIIAITKELLKTDHLELINNELIIGVDGEKLVNSKDFYAMFRSDPAFKVYFQAKAIGELPLDSLFEVDDNILLAARIWKIKDIDFQARKIAVITANDGQKPRFSGSSGVIHPRVREEMLRILYSSQTWPDLNDASADALAKLKSEFRFYQVQNTLTDRPLFITNFETILYTFQGTLINKTLALLLTQIGTDYTHSDHNSSFNLKINPEELQSLIKKLLILIENADQLLETALSQNPVLIASTKWGHLLPSKLQAELLLKKQYDFPGLKKFLDQLTVIYYENDSEV